MQHITDSSVSLAPVAAAPVDVPPNDPVPLLDAPPHDHSRLEGLPAEVRRSILSVLDLECLKGLVRASPTFHQQYLHDRRHVLSVSLHVTLGTASLDAFNVQKAQALESSTPESLESSTLEWKSELLEDWRGSLPHRSSFQLAGVVSEDEAVAMARFYIDVVVPVARYFMKDALGAMRVLDASPIDRSSWEAGPSGTEWRRCLRAAYRFQLLCCIAKPGPRVMPSDVFRATRDSLNRAIKATGIFYAPEPWESEELVTFYEFAEGVYQRVFSNLAAKLRPYKSSVESFESLTACKLITPHTKTLRAYKSHQLPSVITKKGQRCAGAFDSFVPFSSILILRTGTCLSIHCSPVSSNHTYPSAG